MPTVAPSGAGDQPAVEKRDGGTVIKGGNVAANSPMSKTISEAELADDQGGPLGSKVIASDGAGTQYTDKHGIKDAIGTAVTDGVTQLGYQANAQEWVVQGGNVTTTLGGVAYTDLIGGAADIEGANPNRDSTYQLEKGVQYGVVDIDILAAPASGYQSWVTKSGNTGVPFDYVRPSGAGDVAASGSDGAANTTRSVPGELTYMFGGKLPTGVQYKAKDSYES